MANNEQNNSSPDEMSNDVAPVRKSRRSTRGQPPLRNIHPTGIVSFSNIKKPRLKSCRKSTTKEVSAIVHHDSESIGDNAQSKEACRSVQEHNSSALQLEKCYKVKTSPRMKRSE